MPDAELSLGSLHRCPFPAEEQQVEMNATDIRNWLPTTFSSSLAATEERDEERTVHTANTTIAAPDCARRSERALRHA